MQQQLMHQQQQQQHLSAASASFNTSNVTSDHIQQYLDENKALILKILENQNSGKLSECAQNQARLQRNLMYLAAIADSQPQPSSIYNIQAGMNYQQSQVQMASQSHMAVAQSPIMYGHQQYATYAALQQQHHPLHSQLAISSTGTTGGSGSGGGANTTRSEISVGGSDGGVFPDFSQRSITGGEGGLHGMSRVTPNSRNEEDASPGSDDKEDQESNSRKQFKFNS